jgi:hypothetical protein
MKTPKAPGHIPYEPPVQYGRHRIQTVGAAGPAANKTEETHPASSPQAMAGDGFVGIFRAGGNMAAGISNKSGQGKLIEPDQPCPQQTSWCFPPGTLPVTRIFADNFCCMIVCRVFRHWSTLRLRRFSSRSGQGNPPPHQRSASWNCGALYSHAPAQEISDLRTCPLAACRFPSAS